MIQITDPNDPCIEAAAEAFAEFEYAAGEQGLAGIYGSRKNIHDYIRAYAECMADCGLLYATSEKREGIVAFARPGERIGAGAMWKLLLAILSTLGLKNGIKLLKLMQNGGTSLDNIMKKQKKKYIFVGLVAVARPFQGQGYMRKTLEIPFEEGRRLGVPVILETDADLKMKKYVSCGMRLYQERKLCEGTSLYDMIFE